MNEKTRWLPPECWVLVGLTVIAPIVARIIAGRYCESPEEPEPNPTPRQTPDAWPRSTPPRTCSAEELAQLHAVLGDPLRYTCTPEDLEALREAIREREQSVRFQ